MSEPVTIRRIVEDDVPAIVTMARTFLASPDYRAAIVADSRQLETLTRSWLSSEDKACWIAESFGKPVGMMAMMSFVHPMSGEPVASEVVWWVEPASRGIGMRLLHTAEAWAKARGATSLIMIAPNPRVGAFYERVGFSLVEMSYQRSLR